jgi:hypothetical protein
MSGKVAGRQIALEVATFRSSASRRVRTSRHPRLRFDRVATGLVARVQRAIAADVPEGRTAVLTITAPIRLAARTAAAIEQRMSELLARRAADVQTRATIHGNRVSLAIIAGGSAGTAPVVGFVHNPDMDAGTLIDMTRVLLARTGRGRRTSASFAGERWLLVVDPRAAAYHGLFAAVCAALRMQNAFARVLLLLPDESIQTLTP